MTGLQELSDAVEAAKARQRAAWADWHERARSDRHADSREFFACRRETMALLRELDALSAAAGPPAP